MKFLKTFVLTFFLIGTARADLLGHHAGATRFSVSGDGTTVRSISVNEMRFWDVAKRALRSRIPLRGAENNAITALSGNGQRFLWRQSFQTSRSQPIAFRWVLWQQTGSRWRSGSVVAQATLNSRWPLDVQFVGQELLVLWPERIDSFGSNGKLRRRTKVETRAFKVAPHGNKYKGMQGAISPDGKTVLLSQGKLAGIFSVASGLSEQWLELEADYGIYNWYLTDGPFVLGRNRYQADGDERSPEESDEWIWNTRTGKMVCHLKDDHTLAPHFWSPSATAFLEEVGSSPDFSPSGTFQARDVCNPKRSFTFPRSWPLGRVISQYSLSRSGSTLVALDRTGDLWVEILNQPDSLHLPTKPNSITQPQT